MMSKKFEVSLIKTPTLKQLNLEAGRLYEVDGFRYPSITNILGATSDKSALVRWREEVGEVMADQISMNARHRGTSFHKQCERYLLNRPVTIEKPSIQEDPEFVYISDKNWKTGCELFRAAKPLLDRVDEVYMIEQSLASHVFKLAGTVDCVAKYNGKLSIIDFKNSKKPKEQMYIDDYFVQGAFYLNAFYEFTGVLPQQIVILMALLDGSTQEFVATGKDLIHFTKLLKQRVDTFYADPINYATGD